MHRSSKDSNMAGADKGGDVVSKTINHNVKQKLGNQRVLIAPDNLIFSVRKERAKDIVARPFLTIFDSSDYSRDAFSMLHSRFEPAEPRC